MGADSGYDFNKLEIVRKYNFKHLAAEKRSDTIRVVELAELEERRAQEEAERQQQEVELHNARQLSMVANVTQGSFDPAAMETFSNQTIYDASTGTIQIDEAGYERAIYYTPRGMRQIEHYGQDSGRATETATQTQLARDIQGREFRYLCRAYGLLSGRFIAGSPRAQQYRIGDPHWYSLLTLQAPLADVRSFQYMGFVCERHIFLRRPETDKPHILLDFSEFLGLDDSVQSMLDRKYTVEFMRERNR